jgi:flagellar biosynthetic protein FliP
MRQGSAGDAGEACLDCSRPAVLALVWVLLLTTTVVGSETVNSRDRKSATRPPKSEVRDPGGHREGDRTEAGASHRDRAQPIADSAQRGDHTTEIELVSAREEQLSGTAIVAGAGEETAGDWMSLVESLPVAPSLLAVLMLSVVPSLLLMTTCFVRFSIVLTLVRQALGTQQLPPNSVLMALALFLSCLVMEPVWRRAYQEGMRPYMQPEPGVRKPELDEATQATLKPLREFMSSQIELAGNSDTVWVLLESQSSDGDSLRDSGKDLTYDQVPLPTLAAAFVLSEMKVGFIIGFQILLPFLVIDLIVGLVLSMLGLTAISHGAVSLPFKLLLFVLVDGWTVIVGRLLASVSG